MVIRPVAEPFSGRPINKLVNPADHFKPALADLVFYYRSGDLELLHLDFTRLPVVQPRSTIKYKESSI